MQRTLRSAAAVIVIAAAAVIVLPFLWTTEDPIGPNPILFVHYYIDTATIIAVLAITAIAVLILAALARILDRLDSLSGRGEQDRQ